MNLQKATPGRALGLLLLWGSSLSACDDETTSPVEIPDPSQARLNAVEVKAAGELPTSGGDPDDPAIWVNAAEPAKSRILTTDKDNGLFVYDLEGNELQALMGYELNNVDLRIGFSLGGETVDLAVATDRSDDSIAIFTIDPDTGEVAEAPGSGYVVGGEDLFPVYGSCMYRAADGSTYVFVNNKGGAYKQMRVEDDGSGSVVTTEVRTFGIASQPEGCVVDDENAVVFLGEESHGLYRVSADPDSDAQPEEIDSVDNGYISPDVEGITLYRTEDGGGYLLVSSQGDDTMAVYERTGDNAYIGSFTVVDGKFDSVTHSDGIDVTHAALGPLYPDGLVVVHDDDDDDSGRPAFKLLDWRTVAEAFDPALEIDTSADL